MSSILTFSSSISTKSFAVSATFSFSSTIPFTNNALATTTTQPMSIRQQTNCIVYCIVSIHLYGTACSAHQSEALKVRETRREESSLGAIHYNVHTEGGGRVRLWWTHVDRGDQTPCGRPHRKLKLESTDVILSSSHAKKLALFVPKFRLWTEKIAEIFCQCT